MFLSLSFWAVGTVGTLGAPQHVLLRWKTGATPQAPADFRPQGTSAHLLPPAPSLPHPRLIAKRRERGRTANRPKCPLSHPPPPSYNHYPLYMKGRAQRPNPSRLGGSHSSPIQEEKVPPGQLRRTKSRPLPGVVEEMGTAARNGSELCRSSAKDHQQLWVSDRLARALVPPVLCEARGAQTRPAKVFWSLWVEKSLRAQSGGAGGSRGAPIRVGGG